MNIKKAFFVNRKQITLLEEWTGDYRKIVLLFVIIIHACTGLTIWGRWSQLNTFVCLNVFCYLLYFINIKQLITNFQHFLTGANNRKCKTLYEPLQAHLMLLWFYFLRVDKTRKIWKSVCHICHACPKSHESTPHVELPFFLREGGEYVNLSRYTCHKRKFGLHSMVQCIW